MIGMGTLANAAAIITGSLLGILLKKGLPKRIQTILMQASGLAVIFIGLAGALEGLLYINDNKISATGTMLLVFSLIIGGVIGEAINIEKILERAANWLKKVSKSENDSNFVDGFANATLIVCIGAMGIVGAIQDGLTGDYTTLLVKSVIDFIIVFVLASTSGVSVMFSAIPLLVYQGLITVFAATVSPYVSQSLIANLSFIGSVLIFAIGVNLSFGKKYRVANLLPAIIIPIVYEFLF